MRSNDSAGNTRTPGSAAAIRLSSLAYSSSCNGPITIISASIPHARITRTNDIARCCPLIARMPPGSRIKKRFFGIPSERRRSVPLVGSLMAARETTSILPTASGTADSINAWAWVVGTSVRCARLKTSQISGPSGR